MQGMHSPKPRTRHSETCCGIVHQHSRELRNLRILREQKETYIPTEQGYRHPVSSGREGGGGGPSASVEVGSVS